MTKLFYEKLYHTTEPDKVKVKSYLKNIKNITVINENDKNSCEGKIKIEEIKNAVFTMKLNKSPGLDGLPI